MKLRITISKYHSWYLCQISLQTMLLPIQIWKSTSISFNSLIYHCTRVQDGVVAINLTYELWEVRKRHKGLGRGKHNWGLYIQARMSSTVEERWLLHNGLSLPHIVWPVWSPQTSKWGKMYSPVLSRIKRFTLVYLLHFFLCELMNRDIFICCLIFYLLCTFIYFVVSV